MSGFVFEPGVGDRSDIPEGWMDLIGPCYWGYIQTAVVM
jgi:hypothetical protein